MGGHGVIRVPLGSAWDYGLFTAIWLGGLVRWFVFGVIHGGLWLGLLTTACLGGLCLALLR